MKALNQTKVTIIIRKDEIQLSLEVRLVEVAIVIIIPTYLKKQKDSVWLSSKPFKREDTPRNFGGVTTPNHEAYVTKAKLSRNLTRIPIASSYFLTYIAQLLAGKSGGKYDLTLNTFGDIIK